MNKQEIAFVVLLFALLLGWGVVQKRMAPPPRPKPLQEAPQAAGTNGLSAAPSEALAEAVDAPVVEPDAPVMAEAPAETATPDADGDAGHAQPEERVVLSSEEANVTVSSWGGGVTSVELKDFREQQSVDSGPVRLDFSLAPALSISGIPGLTTNNDFKFATSGDSHSVVLERELDSGLLLMRKVALGDDYVLSVTDVLTNKGEEPLVVPQRGVGLGPMGSIQTKAKVRGMSYLGVDTLAAHGGDGVTFWAKKRKSVLHKAFSVDAGGAMPESASCLVQQPVAWAAAKNKFFVQILEPEDGGSDCELHATRDMTVKKGLVLATVYASILFPELVLQPGEAHTQTARYFVGPKKFAILKSLGQHQDEVMQFGFFKPICKPLLWVLNWIHALLPNYGVAIILLTVLVRLIFWPITHKSTESMKKMQQIQPLVTQVREKYKDKPQKMNQEVMALYKEHKVNPMAGCLPMVIQIPVFIGLFTVLRSAVELRFASFLWIRDLSEPEGLFQAALQAVPFLGSGLNILPLFMTCLTVLQQRMTPSAGDPQQQKMMMLMPVFFLFIFYSMPSALVLYWSTSQGLAVVQLVMQRRKSAGKGGALDPKAQPSKPNPLTKKSKGKK